jgi:hypothetical protein
LDIASEAEEDTEDQVERRWRKKKVIKMAELKPKKQRKSQSPSMDTG